MIYLVRHGQTEFNAMRRIQGAMDSALTPLGMEQGRRLGLLLAGLEPAPLRIVTSPQGRAQHTARLIREASGLLCEIEIDERLREVSVGAWDGLLRDDIAALDPDFDVGDRRLTWFFRGPGGDTYEALEARLAEWLEAAHACESPTIVVSHGVAGRILRGLYLGLSRTETLSLDVPQDAVFRLACGTMERIDCPAG
jgi:broad specificity phosphatase PhoE